MNNNDKMEERKLLLQQQQKKRMLIVEMHKNKKKKNISKKMVNDPIYDTFFSKQNIKQVCISKGLSHFSERLYKIYGLKELFDKGLPCLFFGMYEKEDLEKIRNHKGLKYLIWGGSDLDLSFGTLQKNKIINKIKKLEMVHFAISTSLYNRLQRLNIQSTLIKFNLCDKSLYKQLGLETLVNNNSILVYNGIKPGLEHIYNKTLYEELVQKNPEFNYIYSNTLNLKNEEMFLVYKKCFLGIRLTLNDGNANMVQEMDLCNINVLHNGDEKNCIKWTNDNIFNKIKEENINIFIKYIKEKYTSVLFLCTDYPSYGGAATNTHVMLNYFIKVGIKAYAIFIHTSSKEESLYNITTIANFPAILKKYTNIYSFDLIITRNYIDKRIIQYLPQIPIYFLVPGIFRPTLDTYYTNLKTKSLLDKHINKYILKTCKISEKVFVASNHTKSILEKFYNINTNILCFNHIPFLNKEIPKIKDNYLYKFGIIISDFDRGIKNVDFLIKKLVETKQKIILIGKNSIKYQGPNITIIGLLSHEKIKEYFSKIQYVINDSFYESCSNTLLEALYYGSMPLQNFSISSLTLEDITNIVDKSVFNKNCIIVDNFNLTFSDILQLNSYNKRIYQITNNINNNNNTLYCKNSLYNDLAKLLICKKYGDIFVYDQNGLYIIKQSYANKMVSMFLTNPYLYLSWKPLKQYIKKDLGININEPIDSSNKIYKNLIKDSIFMDEILKLVFCCDKNYILGLITVINSIIVNTKYLNKIIFHICVPKTDLLYMKNIFEVFNFPKFNYIFITFDNVDLDHISLKNDGNHLKSIGNFIRLNIGNIFNNNKVVYIDSDIVFNVDIYEISYLQIYNPKNIISGIKSETTFEIILNSKNVTEQYEILKNVNLNKKIINTGIYVLNCYLWNKQNIYSKIMEILSIHNQIKGGLFRCFTMSLLNLALCNNLEYFANHKIVIDLGWKTINLNILDNADLLDWSGNAKPWLFSSINYKNYWDRYYPELKIETANILISHPLDSMGGAQHFTKFIINNSDKKYIIFHNSKFENKLFENVIEFDLEPNLICNILKKVKVNNIIINNASWYLEKHPSVCQYLLKTYSCKIIVHNEYSPALRFIYNNKDYIKEIICVNNKISNKLKNFKTTIIMPFTSTSFITTRNINKDKIFAYVGRFCKYKFIDPIINVFTKLGLTLWLVGNYDNNYDLRSKVLAPNIKILLNANMSEIYNNIDYLVLTSVTEGMPCSILEAMGYGIPVISTNVGGISDIIKHQYNGYLIESPILDNFDYLDNFDIILNTFILDQVRIEKDLEKIINSLDDNEYTIISNNAINTIKNIYQENIRKIRLV